MVLVSKNLTKLRIEVSCASTWYQAPTLSPQTDPSPSLCVQIFIFIYFNFQDLHFCNLFLLSSFNQFQPYQIFVQNVVVTSQVLFLWKKISGGNVVRSAIPGLRAVPDLVPIHPIVPPTVHIHLQHSCQLALAYSQKIILASSLACN